MKYPTNILIVEDNPADRKLIEVALGDVLNSVNYRFATDGETALEYLRNGAMHRDSELPDFIILDQNMPRMDGFELLHEIRENERLRDIRIAMFSTSPLPKWCDPPTPHRADAYLTKPFDVDDYTRIIRDLCLEWIAVKKL